MDALFQYYEPELELKFHKFKMQQQKKRKEFIVLN